MTRKRKIIIFSSIAGVVLLAIIFGATHQAPPTIQTDTVKVQDIQRTVLATGTVTSGVDLDLSFKTSGIVQKIPVKVGQVVEAGTVLVQLDSRDQLASLAQARAAMATAQANKTKVLSGATGEEIDVAQKSVDAAQVAADNAQKNLSDTKKQQDVLVRNAYTALLNTGITAIPTSSLSSGVTATVSGTYTGTGSAQYTVRASQSGGGWRYEASGPGAVSGYIIAGVPLLLTNNGLYIQFSALPSSGNDSWVIDVPNIKASGYVTAQSIYLAAVETRQAAVTAAENAIAVAKASLDQAIASLNLKKAQARPADLQAAEAQVLSAAAQVSAAQASYENTMLRAPVGGTVTAIDIKIGEQASALKSIVTVQDVTNLYVEANVSEASIAQVLAGQNVSYTFDALGPDRHFTGRVTSIDPASTVVSGVVNYKVTASVDGLQDIKPGMTANMSIVVAQKPKALTVPLRAVVTRDGKEFVRVITNTKQQKYEEREVHTNLEADGGLVEVTSGLSEGQTVVTFVEEKK